MKARLLRRAGWSLILTVCVVVGCSHRSTYQSSDGPPSRHINVASIKDAVPRIEPRSKQGNPASYVIFGQRYYPMKSSSGYTQRGVASWYGSKFHGRKTSNGERYDMYAMTAAHKTLPLPTYVRVTNLRNQRSIKVRVNDRGPFHNNRIIDLSWAAANKIGMLGKGTALVEVTAIDPRHPHKAPIIKAEPAKPATGIYLQVGAFANRSNAERMRDRIQGSGIPGTRLLTANIDEMPVYRVQVGPVRSVQEADRVSDDLAQLGITQTQIIIP